MLCQSEEGKHGLKALFVAYNSQFGKEALALATEFGYTVSTVDISFEKGRLDVEKKRIIASRQAPKISTEFTIFHEMAHHFLHPFIPVREGEMVPADESDEIEYWCDHFALAMFLARRGARVMNYQDHEGFLTHGSDAAYDGRDVFPWRQSAVLAKRIPGIARKFFKPRSQEYKDCIVLQHVLLLASKIVRASELD